jgi:catechol 2,3-dioxygenase-like lactoylglutathione lyase family enzyme
VLARHVLTILAVDDLPRAVGFYVQGFGWEKVVNVPVYVEFALPGGMRLGLYQREGFGRNTGKIPAHVPAGELAPTEIYFHVDDIGSAIDRLRRAGARELSPLSRRDWGDEAAYFADPDGNVVVLARSLPEEGGDQSPSRDP